MNFAVSSRSSRHSLFAYANSVNAIYIRSGHMIHSYEFFYVYIKVIYLNLRPDYRVIYRKQSTFVLWNSGLINAGKITRKVEKYSWPHFDSLANQLLWLHVNSAWSARDVPDQRIRSSCSRGLGMLVAWCRRNSYRGRIWSIYEYHKEKVCRWAILWE